MNTAPRSVSVVYPCYNEQANVVDTLRRSVAALESLGVEHELLLVDDGSVDESARIAEEAARQHGWSVRVIRNPVNLGVGLSILVGLRAATKEIVLHNAMDYPFDLADLRAVLPLFREADIVAVVRTDRSAHSPFRKLTSLVNHWLIRALFRPGLRDMNFIQAYRTDVLAGLSIRAKSPAFVTPELLIRAKRKGIRIAQIQLPFHPRMRGSASHGKPRDILWTLADMVAFWLEAR